MSFLDVNDGNDDKNRLFETHQTASRSLGNYFKLMLIVAACVAVAGAVIFYFTLPGIGDRVKAPAGLEDQIRNHLIDKEKRTPTDIAVYYCGNFYWAAVDVETRPDIPGTPINRVSRFRVTAIQTDASSWTISAVPVSGPDPDVPCK